MKPNASIRCLVCLFVASSIACTLTASGDEASPLWINSGLNNRDLTLTPDGNLMLSTVMAPANQFATIVMWRKRGGRWQDAEIAPFSGRYPDIEPMFSPDGSKLFFASKRPNPDRDGSDWDIWFVHHDDGNFSEPINPGEPINTAANEFYPSVAANGNLYFTSQRDGGAGSEDIFFAQWAEGAYSSVKPLGAGVNTAGFEFNAFVSPDESYLIFSAQGRADDMGGGDLYISFRDDSGAFAPAIHLPEPVNSAMLDYCPFVVGDRFYFTSRRFAASAGFSRYQDVAEAFQSAGNGLGDIYWVPLSRVMVQ